MLGMLYALTGQTATEAASVTDFHSQFVKNGEMEEMFYEAIHDSRLSGFQEGIKAMLRLIAEVR